MSLVATESSQVGLTARRESVIIDLDCPVQCINQFVGVSLDVVVVKVIVGIAVEKQRSSCSIRPLEFRKQKIE